MILGIIGGVGAGKSTVLALLTEAYGFTAYRTDDIAKSFYVTGHPVFEALKQLLGPALEGPDGRAFLAQKLYGPGGASLRAEVDCIVHPAVWEFVDEKIAEARKDGHSIVIETALPTRHFTEGCDETWFVYTDEEVRVARLMASRGYSEEKARAMIHAQMDNAGYAAFADWTVDNSGSREETETAIRMRLRTASQNKDVKDS